MTTTELPKALYAVHAGVGDDITGIILEGASVVTSYMHEGKMVNLIGSAETN